MGGKGVPKETCRCPKSNPYRADDAPMRLHARTSALLMTAAVDAYIIESSPMSHGAEGGCQEQPGGHFRGATFQKSAGSALCPGAMERSDNLPCGYL